MPVLKHSLPPPVDPEPAVVTGLISVGVELPDQATVQLQLSRSLQQTEVEAFLETYRARGGDARASTGGDIDVSIKSVTRLDAPDLVAQLNEHLELAHQEALTEALEQSALRSAALRAFRLVEWPKVPGSK